MSVVIPAAYPVETLRKAFPGLQQSARGKPLIYFDNAATAQVPLPVLDALTQFHRNDRANIHRAVHELGQRATESYDAVRPKVAKFIGAKESREVVFVRGTTEAINLVANTWGRQHIGPGDQIVLSQMEHHSNIVPWQLLAEQVGAEIKVVPINDKGELDFDAYTRLLGSKTKLVALTHVSNALGTINPVKDIIQAAHAKNIPVLIDGAQAVPHAQVNVAELDADFYAFSAHKMYGPTGIGALYAKAELLMDMPPWHGGGDMIDQVSFSGTTYADIPHRFEAGTPDIAGVIGLGAAIDFLSEIGMEEIAQWESHLLKYAHQRLDGIPGVRPIGTAAKKAGVYSFVVDGVHAHDIGTLLDMEGIAVRTGHHCAQPVMERFGISSTARASFGLYNTIEEIDVFASALERVLTMFHR